MFELFVGVDVAKDSSTARGLKSNGTSLFSIEFDMNIEGFSNLLKAITDNGGEPSSVLVAMESTACYHINLFSFLSSKGFSVVVINPLLISNFAKLSLRKTKTDKKDALTIAQFI
jgi:transposase